MERFSVRSPDNVEISVGKDGEGPALLLVHGALLNGIITWSPVLGELSKHFTVYMMDRRGRAPSGDGTSDYSIALEAADIAKVVESIGRPVTILAHSYGALSTIEAMDQLRSVTQLILYEPPGLVPPEEKKAGVAERLHRALVANDREEIATVFLRDQIGAPQEVIAGLKSSLIWPIILEISPTLPRESKGVNTYPASADRLARSKYPVVMFLGGISTGHIRDSTLFGAQHISGCRLVTLEGQGHSAMMQAPRLFLATVLDVTGISTSRRA
jgi:pimeloyl-ACP methyl ester carboxylesterase